MKFTHSIRDDQFEAVVETIAKINNEQGFITKEQLADAMKNMKMYSFRRDLLRDRLEALNIVVRTTVREVIEEQPVVKKKIMTRKRNKN